MILIVVSIFSMLVFQFRFLWFSISLFVFFSIFNFLICGFSFFICGFEYLYLWFQFLHLWFSISSISSFVVFQFFFSTDLPTFLSFFTLLSFWNLPYRLFQLYTAGSDIFMTLPCFFDRPTVVFSIVLPGRWIDFIFPDMSQFQKRTPQPKCPRERVWRLPREYPSVKLDQTIWPRTGQKCQKWTNTNSVPSEELKAGQECIWS